MQFLAHKGEQDAPVKMTFDRSYHRCYLLCQIPLIGQGVSIGTPQFKIFQF